MTNSLHRLPVLILACLLFWAPVPLGSIRPWSSWLLSAVALLVAALVALTLATGARMPTVLRRAWPAHLGFALILGVTLGQLCAGIGVTTEVLRSGALTLALWSAFAAVICSARDNRSQRILVGAVVAAGLVQSVYGAWVVLTGTDHVLFIQKVQHLESATGTYISRNNFAAHVALSLCLGIGVMAAHLAEPARSVRAFVRGLAGALVGGKGAFRLVLIAMVVGLVLSRSRMGNTAFFLALTLGTLLGALLARRLRSQLLVFSVSVVLLDVLVIGAYFGVERVVERIRDTSMAAEQRDEVARDALTLASEHWLTGVGAGSWKLAFERYRGADLGFPQDFAHNDYLQLAGEYGIVGLSGFVLLVGSSAWAALLALRRRSSRMYAGLGLSGIMAITYWLTQATVDFNAYLPALALLFVTLLALCWVGAHAVPASRHESTG